MAAPKSKVDLRWELLPIFLNILGFALGFFFYGERMHAGKPETALFHAAQEKYGAYWDAYWGAIQWGIPAVALGGYLALSLGVWGLARVADPVKDWNALCRVLGRPTIDDPERKEAVRARLLRWLYF